MRYNKHMTEKIEQFTVEFVLAEDAQAALGADLMGGAIEASEGVGIRVAFACTPERRREVDQRVRDWGYAEIALRRRPWDGGN